MVESLWGIPTIYLLGFIGVVTGFFSGLLGLGGGWLLTPLLSILGYPAAMAIGTSMTQMTGTAVIGGFTHFRAGRLIPRLAITMVVPMVIGVLIGKSFTTSLAAAGIGDTVLKGFHFGLSALLGFQILVAALRGGDKREPALWLKKLRELPLGPRVSFAGGRSSSIAIPIAAGFIAGIASGLTGIGGGLILFPIMVTVVGLTAAEAVATNLVCMIFSAGIGALAYATDSNVDFLAAGYLLVGAILGSYAGAKVIRIVSGNAIRIMFSGMLLMTCLSLGLRLAGLEQASTVSIFGGALLSFSAATLYIASIYFREKGAENS